VSNLYHVNNQIRKMRVIFATRLRSIDAMFWRNSVRRDSRHMAIKGNVLGTCASGLGRSSDWDST
jgi:hypothetical protein